MTNDRIFLVRFFGDLVFKTISVKEPSPYVCHVELNRPEKYNSFNAQLWT